MGDLRKMVRHRYVKRTINYQADRVMLRILEEEIMDYEIEENSYPLGEFPLHRWRIMPLRCPHRIHFESLRSGGPGVPW